MITMRNATMEDAESVLKIYDYYVKNTAITFEYETPSLTEFQERMNRIIQKYPFLVLEVDNQIKGYAYAGPFVGRAAYDWSCETTIYLENENKKLGYGRRLYEALEKALKNMGILNLYACIGYPEEEDQYLTRNSVDFHTHLGYREVGKFQKCGYKFGRWYHMIWMEKIIGMHDINQQPVKRYIDSI